MRVLAETQDRCAAAGKRAGSLGTLRGLGIAAAAAGARGRGVVVFSVGNQVGTRGTLPHGRRSHGTKMPRLLPRTGQGGAESVGEDPARQHSVAL